MSCDTQEIITPSMQYSTNNITIYEELYYTCDIKQMFLIGQNVEKFYRLFFSSKTMISMLIYPLLIAQTKKTKKRDKPLTLLFFATQINYSENR